MKNYILSFFAGILLFVTSPARSQSSEEMIQFNKERLKIQKTGMLVLSGWAVGNIATGFVGYHSSEGSVAQLYKMNILWNCFNLGLAVPSYIGARKSNYDLPFRKTYKIQQNFEKTFLANAALDVAYIAGGLYLAERGRHQTDIHKHDMNVGFGNSIMLQGAFLMLFDATMYAVHVSHGNKKLSPYLDKVVIGYNGIGFRHQF